MSPGAAGISTRRNIHHGRHSTGSRRRQEAPVLQHRRRRLARAPRRPLHRARGLLQPDGLRRRAAAARGASTASATGPASARSCRPRWRAWSTRPRRPPEQPAPAWLPRRDRVGVGRRVLPADAVEVGRVLDAWGVKGWIKVQPYRQRPAGAVLLQALVPAAARRPPGRPARDAAAPLPALLRMAEAREHGDGVVAAVQDVDDRNAPKPCAARASSCRAAAFPPPAATSSTGST